MAADGTHLNENQARRLRVSCQHIDTLLSGIEETLNESGSKTAFPHYSSDITPAQRRTIEDYIARIRAQLVRVLDGQGIVLEPPTIPASRSIRFTLVSVDIAVEELKPKYMRGYGEVPKEAATDLNGIVGELQGLVTRLNRYLAEGVGQDLGARLQRLEQAGNDLPLLSMIERVVAERGLVEFRGTIAAIVDRAEDKTFEIAVFGRVSSGKSSLLNAMLDTDVLPVGVTPITAVPTRISYGEKPFITVSYTESPPKSFDITQLGEFATEQQNPGNAKHVTRIVVTLPAARLRGGVAFVDTPGLGSLATSGAAETLSYLPKCDLGVVLIDAASTLTTEDVQTILSLEEAVIPAHVLLSKADLLDPQDCQKTVQYVKQHIASECNLDLPVYPVSVRPAHRHLLDRWFGEEILPLYNNSQELRMQSLQRKIGLLRESVISALEIRLRRTQQSLPGGNEKIREVEARLRRAMGLIEETRSTCERELETMSGDFAELSRGTAVGLLDAWARDKNRETLSGDVIRASVLQFMQKPMNLFENSLETLALQLQNDLRRSAHDLGLTDMPGEDEFLSLVRGMPVFDPGTIHLSVTRAPYGTFFGKKYAENQLAEQIRQELGKSFGQSLANYSGALKEWMRSITRELGQVFETYADRYRAHAAQAFGGEELTPDEIHAIKEDLKMLGQPTSPVSGKRIAGVDNDGI